MAALHGHSSEVAAHCGRQADGHPNFGNNGTATTTYHWYTENVQNGMGCCGTSTAGKAPSQKAMADSSMHTQHSLAERNPSHENTSSSILVTFL